MARKTFGSDAKHWEIHGTRQLSEDEAAAAKAKGWGAYRENFSYHVVAATMARAIELVLAREPRGELWTVTHRGKLDIVEDSAEP